MADNTLLQNMEENKKKRKEQEAKENSQPIFEQYPPPAAQPAQEPMPSTPLSGIAMGDPNETPSPSEAKSSIDELEQGYRKLMSRGLDETSAASLEDAINKARQAYEQKAKRYEWADIATDFGRNLIQLAAAVHGKRTDRDMSKLQFEAKPDYQRKIDQARQEYGMALGEEEGKFRRSQAARKEKQALEKEATLEPIKARMAEERLSDRMAKQAQAQEERAARSADLWEASTELKDRNKEYQAASKELDLATKPEISSKELKKLSPELQEQRSQADDFLENGWLESDATWYKRVGKYDTNKDKKLSVEEKRAAYQEMMGEKANNLSRQIQELKDRIHSLKSGREVPTRQPQAPEQSNSGMIRMQAPDGSIGEIPASKAAEAEKQGFKRL